MATGRLDSFPPIALALLALVACSPLQPESARRSPALPADGEITRAVLDVLATDRTVPAGSIDVATTQGVVSLSGPVSSLLAAERAVRLAETVRGVRGVIDRIVVRPWPDRADASIAVDVRHAIAAEPAVAGDDVAMVAEGGRVTLRGTVGSHAEKRLAALAAKGVKGVLGLDDELAVAHGSERSDQEIATDVRRMLVFDEYVDGGSIEVEVDGGDVALMGTGGSAAERRRAAGLARVRGVRMVDTDRLLVAPSTRDRDLRTGRHIGQTDEAIATAVVNALRHDPRVGPASIDVQSIDGVVTLRGAVEDLRAWRAAAQDADNTVGVWKVDNRLVVRPNGAGTDAEIAERVRAAIARDPYLDGSEVAVTVQQGTVHLQGSVGSGRARQRADELAAQTRGVIDVRNELEVTGPEVRTRYQPYLTPHLG